MAKRLEDLNLTDTQKKILGVCGMPRTMSEIGIKLDLNYSWIWQLANRMAGKGLLNKIHTPSGKVLYQTNDREVIL